MDWYFNNRNRRYKNSGYSDLGRIQIPPLPPKIVLTDRTTKIQWQLTFDISSGFFSIATPNLSFETADIYDINSGPRFPEDTNYTLILDNGVLSALYEPFPLGITDMETAPIYARNGNSYLEVTLSNISSTPSLDFSNPANSQYVPLIGL